MRLDPERICAALGNVLAAIIMLALCAGAMGLLLRAVSWCAAL